jgi:hypothetical protein
VRGGIATRAALNQRANKNPDAMASGFCATRLMEDQWLVVVAGSVALADFLADLPAG